MNTKKPTYTGVVLDGESRTKLLNTFSKYIPTGWKSIAHHMTIDPFNVDADDNIGEKIVLTATEFGISVDAAAVKVSGYDKKTKNKFPHITVAIPQDGKAKNSNDIVKWVKLKNPIELNGTISNI
jgi:hypothetical protein